MTVGTFATPLARRTPRRATMKPMTDAQLYLAIGIPSFALVLGMVGNGLLFNALSARVSDLRSYIDARFDAEQRVNEASFKMILDKVEDIDSRLSRMEER